MINKEYFELILPIMEEMGNKRNIAKEIANGILGKNMLKDDMFFCAAIDRCMHLIDGFIVMLKERNLTCVGALLRLQMDNCMRSYAAFLAEDKDKVIDCIINGDRIDNHKSKDGKLLKDGYLKRELTKIYSKFAEVYDNTSGYVHLSDKAFYQMLIRCENNVIEMGIGLPLQDKYNPVLIEAANAFCRFTDLFYNLMTAVVESKKKFDKKTGV